MYRSTRTIIIGSLLFIALVSVTTLHFKSQSQIQAPPGLRAQRDTWTPLMDVLKEKGRPRVTDEQLTKMKSLPIEAMWGAVQGKGYRFCFVNHLKLTQPGVKMVGRALTMRYLPVRPDLDEGVRQLGKEGVIEIDKNAQPSNHLADTMDRVARGVNFMAARTVPAPAGRGPE